MQLKLINEYDPIFKLLDIKRSLKFKVLAGKYNCQKHMQLDSLAAQQESTNNCDKKIEKD